MKTTSTPMETSKPLLKDAEAEDVDVHLYRSMIGSLMYLTSSRPDIMFVVCACARFQVTPKVSHLHAVKRIFRYFKGQPKLGLWYPKDSPFDLEAYSDSDYAGAIVNSTTEAEYVVVASCCGQVLWIQNQMLDYGYNFMNTNIFIDNESTICIVKNPVIHSKTKHIKIRHHFIRDSNEKKLIQLIKIHTDQNVVDLLTKAFDVGRFQYLIASANDEIQVSAVGLTYYSFRENYSQDIVMEEVEITATIDGKVKIFIEASIRRHLKLEDSDGISNFPTTEIFKQLALMGQETEVPQPSSPPHTLLYSTMSVLNIQSVDVQTEGLAILMQHNELMDLVTKLSNIVVALKTDLQQTKKVYGAAFTKLIKKGRKIDEIDQDPDIYLVQHDTEFNFDFNAAKEVSTAKEDVSTAKPISTAGVVVTTASVVVTTASPIKAFTAEDITMAESLVYIRRSAEKTKDKDRRGFARVHESASSFNVEEWEDIKARVKADEELAQKLQTKEREKYSEVEQARMLIELINQRRSP
ncbi:hypothetical protein Tco_0456285 [Tanacetum coccineum]